MPQPQPNQTHTTTLPTPTTLSLSKMGIYYDIDSIQREEARAERGEGQTGPDGAGKPQPQPYHHTSSSQPQSAPFRRLLPTAIVGTHSPGFMVHETNHCNGPICWAGTGGEVVEVMNIRRLVWVRLTEADRSPDMHLGVMYSEMAALRDGEAIMRGEIGDRVDGLWMDTRGVLYTGMGTVHAVSDCAMVPILRCPGGCGWQADRGLSYE